MSNIIVTTNIPIPFMLDADGRSLIERVARLLVRLQQPSLMARAQNEGYTDTEHQIGWDLMTEAGGGTTTVAINAASGALQSADAKTAEAALARLQQIDAFENVWFQRTRVIIRRVVTDGTAAAFEKAFFDELEQQPLGPGVIASVSKYLSRLASLDTTPDSPGALVRATLSARGLTKERVEEMSKLVAEAKAATAPIAPVSDTTTEQVAAANARRTAALNALELWYDDWSTTFRTVFGVREQIKLGLTDGKGKVASKKKVKDKEVKPAEDAPANPG